MTSAYLLLCIVYDGLDIFIIILAILYISHLAIVISIFIAIMIEITAMATLAVSFKLFRAILPYIRSSYVPPSDKYIIINGCTDGIGKQYALHFAKNSTPLVLIGRNQSKLEELKKQIKLLKQNCDCKILKIDYADQNINDAVFIQLLVGIGLKEHSVSGFINCCGEALLQKYSEYAYANIQRLKRINTCSLELALKAMNSHLISNNPFIINLSSHTSHFPLKYSSVYSATKAYSSNLFTAYAHQNPNIKSLLVQPWYVTTKMTGNKKRWDYVSPQEVVRGSLRAINSRLTCSGTIKHQLIHQFNYLIQKYYSWTVLEQNYQRVLKLRELRTKRIKKSSSSEIQNIEKIKNNQSNKKN